MEKRNTIFKLIVIEYNEKKPKYPKFKVWQYTAGYYSTLQKAEQEIKKIVESDRYKEPPNKLFGFLIEEYALDNSPFYWSVESRRNYLHDGSLWDECLMSETPDEEGYYEHFLGRPKEGIRFNPGDMVEALCERANNTVTLEIIGNCPKTTEIVQKLRDTYYPPDFHLDSSDDCYYSLDIDGEHSHPSPVTLFPARLKISKALKKKYLNDEYYSCRACFENKEEKNEL